jgi:hypothetical protein
MKRQTDRETNRHTGRQTDRESQTDKLIKLRLTSSGLNLKVDVIRKCNFVRNIGAIAEHDLFVGVGQDGEHLEGEGVRGVSGDFNQGLLESDGRCWENVNLK